jgi:integrase
MLEWYVTHHRKAGPDNRYLFAGEGGTHRTNNTLRNQLMETVHRFTGLTINPHLFRAIAGTIYLDANPGAYETVRLLLGHTSISTTTRFYAAHMERKAKQHFADTVRRLREAPEGRTGQAIDTPRPRKKRKV